MPQMIMPPSPSFLGSGRQALGLCAKGAVVLVDPPATARAPSLRTHTPVRDTKCGALQAGDGEGACGSLAAPLWFRRLIQHTPRRNHALTPCYLAGRPATSSPSPRGGGVGWPGLGGKKNPPR